MHIKNKNKSFRISALVITLAVCTLPGLTFSGVENAQVMEKIVARVGNYPILISELAGQIQLTAMQTGFKPTSDEEVRLFQEDVLQQLVNEKLFLIAAQQDTTMRVTDDEIQEELDAQMAKIADRFPSEQAFLDAITSEGMTLRELRRKLYSEIESRLLRDKFISRKLQSVTISRQEVKDFYQKYKDSIPDQPAAVRIAHVLIPYASSGVTVDSVKNLAAEIREKAAIQPDVVSFNQLATEYSAPPSGDLGYVKRQDVTSDFGNAIFKLQPGDVSGVVRTSVGFHIVRVTDKGGDSIRVSQIFFPVQATVSDTANSWKLADSVATMVRSGSLTFAEAAKEYSSDNDTRRTEGELGWYAYTELPAEFKSKVTPKDTVGQIIGPLSSSYGLHIVKVLEKREPEKISLENSYDHLRELARRFKTEEVIQQWVDKRREDTYVEIRPID